MDGDIHLPYVPGIVPPAPPPGPAVGFSTSTADNQAISTNIFGKTLQKLVTKLATPICVDSMRGEMQIEILGGAACWISFSEILDITSYRLKVNRPFTASPIVPVWGIIQNDPDITPTLVQLTLIAEP